MMQVFYVQTALNFLLDLKKQNLHVVKDKKFVAMYTKVQMPQKNHKNMWIVSWFDILNFTRRIA